VVRSRRPARHRMAPETGKPIAAVCHSPAVFHRAMYDGVPLLKGKRVTGFTNGEEAAVDLTEVVPFLVEDELKRIGGLYEKAHRVRPERRNPHSIATIRIVLARLLLRQLHHCPFCGSRSG
ncbi:MAG: hypothetical protein ABI759_16835, partial [Candidatus Solibacter sp.]